VVYDETKAVRASGEGYIPCEEIVLDTVEKLKPIL
jgi:hypothetical protein